MKTVTVKQIQALDQIAIEKCGIPSLILMENAGRAVAQEILKRLRKKKNPVVTSEFQSIEIPIPPLAGPDRLACRTGRQRFRCDPAKGGPKGDSAEQSEAYLVCVVCGRGNNAGDGFVAARHLLNAGIKTRIFLIGQETDLKNDAAVNCQILKKCGYRIEAGNTVSRQELSRADVVVDAIFGVGLNRPIAEPFKTVVASINKEAKYVVSLDIPSGLDGTTGKVYGVCVKADLTVTLSLAKKGFFKNEGPLHTGNIIVANIGIPCQFPIKTSTRSSKSFVTKLGICPTLR